MTVTYQILETLDLVYVRNAGRIDLREASTALKEYMKDSRFRQHQRQLIDMRSLDDALAAFWEMNEFKKIYEQFYDAPFKPVHVAIVAPSPFSKRLIWMYSRVVRDKKTIRLVAFDDMSAALAHLRIPERTFDDLLEQEINAKVIQFKHNSG